MPTESLRSRAISTLATQISTIVDGSADYFTSLGGQGQVTLVPEMRDQRMSQPYDHWVYIQDGTEEFPDDEQEVTGRRFGSRLEILLDLFVRDQAASSMVTELNHLIHDVMLAIGKDITLGGLVSNLHAVSIDTPIYSVGDKEGSTVIHTECVYDFETGVTI